MKRNTNCTNYQQNCPPAMACDKVKARSVACDADGHYPYYDLDVPVVLSEVDLQATVEADVHLPTPAREIKAIKKNVSLTQCEAFKSPYNYGKVKLFITGVVHKNIQYVEACSGNLKDYSVDVPFTCSDEVEVFDHVDQYASQKSSLTAEYRYLDKHNHGADRCRNGSFTYEFFNEPIECKLLYADIFELDLYKDHDRFGRFSRITEKMDINLWFKLLQTQQRRSSRGYHPKDDCESSSSSSGSYGDEMSHNEAMDHKEQTMMDRINERINNVRK
ncbi:CsxC family protein [Halobacillus sp. MO56]